jgi:hypothetical protein
MQAALRSLDDGRTVHTSVIYIVRATPELPVQTAFSAPQARALPGDFPTPYLVLNGETPIAVRWSNGSGGGTYEVTLLSHDAPASVTTAYRQVLAQQKMQITSDTAQGTGTTLEFASPDQTTTGSLTVDVFDQDNSYAVTSLQVRTTRGPQPTSPAPGATGTPPPAGATAAPSATAKP